MKEQDKKKKKKQLERDNNGSMEGRNERWWRRVFGNYESKLKSGSIIANHRKRDGGKKLKQTHHLWQKNGNGSLHDIGKPTWGIKVEKKLSRFDELLLLRQQTGIKNEKKRAKVESREVWRRKLTKNRLKYKKSEEQR